MPTRADPWGAEQCKGVLMFVSLPTRGGQTRADPWGAEQCKGVLMFVSLPTRGGQTRADPRGAEQCKGVSDSHVCVSAPSDSRPLAGRVSSRAGVCVCACVCVHVYSIVYSVVQLPYTFMCIIA